MDIKTLQVGPIGTNCYILCDEAKQRCAVIDPGGDAGRVAAAVEDSGGLTVSVLTTPGHSEGSVTLRCGDVLFCGDTLFAGSCGRTDFPGGSVKKMMESLKRLGGLEGDLKVCPGHMEDSTLDRERSWNPYLRQAMNG